jgi:hypothetical protein
MLCRAPEANTRINKEGKGTQKPDSNQIHQDGRRGKRHSEQTGSKTTAEHSVNEGRVRHGQQRPLLPHSVGEQQLARAVHITVSRHLTLCLIFIHRH